MRLLVAMLMFSIMAVMVTDVIGRYFLSMPIKGGFEIIGLLLGLLIFASFSLNAHSNDFIVVGLFDYAFHGWAKRGRDLLVLAVSAAALGFLGWRMWTLGDLFYASSQPGKYFDIKMWPFAYAFAALGAVACVTALAFLWRSVRSGAADFAGPPGQ
jgi:TRAP-type C4-dicarboxylate transport system permease small subunit